MATRYYRIRAGGQLYGLVRRRDGASGAPVLLSYARDGEWVEDASLYRYWVDPGDSDLVEVDAADANLAAAALGVKLTAKSARVAPVEEDAPDDLGLSADARSALVRGVPPPVHGGESRGCASTRRRPHPRGRLRRLVGLFRGLRHGRELHDPSR